MGGVVSTANLSALSLLVACSVGAFASWLVDSSAHALAG
jgi:hypothetical protein